MKRRSVVLGLGTVTIGSGTAFGTGAFTQIEADRDATVTLVNDDEGYLAIDARSDSNYVTDDGGTLRVDLGNVNRDSTLRVGEEQDGDPVSSEDHVAFIIDNNSEVDEIDVTAEASLEGSGEISDPDTELQFRVPHENHNVDDDPQTGDIIADGIDQLEDRAYVNVVVEASDEDAADIDEITFTATPS